MRGGAAILACVLLAGCGETTPEPQAPAATIASAALSTPAPLATVIDYGSPEILIGEWRVAGIDGRAINGSMGIAVSVDVETLSFEPRCAGFAWRYGYADGALEMARQPAPPMPPGLPPPVCAVAVPPEHRALGQALDAVTEAHRTASNGVELRGGGRSVTLYRQ